MPFLGGKSMGTNELRKRDIWQDNSGGKATVAEHNFEAIFLQEFKGSDFRVRPKPKEFNDIYSKIELSKEILSNIYNPTGNYGRHGIIPDFAIDNIKTKKTLYVEVKRQDGWVEGKKKSDGRGNAHERSCKFFTPGLLKILSEHGKLGNNVLPFWVVFQGDIARDPRRVREIHCWYGDYHDHFFFWHNSTDSKSLVSHFNKKLKHLLT